VTATPDGEDAPLSLDLTLVQEHRRPDVADVSEAAWADLASHVLRAERASGDWEVALVLVDDDRLRRMHADFMGIDEPTDVMTFERDPEDGEPGAAPARGGDIVVSLDRAAAQAGEHGQAPEGEVRFLVVHGLLHLAGWVDGTDAERAAMLARGEALLRTAGTDPAL
jgi:probable rRNA maturation factor